MDRFLEDYLFEAASKPIYKTQDQKTLQKIYDDLDFIINCETWDVHQAKDDLIRIRKEIGVLIE